MPYASKDKRRKVAKESATRARVREAVRKVVTAEDLAASEAPKSLGTAILGKGSTKKPRILARKRQSTVTRTAAARIERTLDLSTVAGALEAAKAAASLVLLDPLVDADRKAATLLSAARVAIESRKLVSMESELAEMRATIELLRKSRAA